MRCAYISHPSCARHEMGAHHPESPERLRMIEDALAEEGVLDLLLPHEAPPVSQQLLEQVHEAAYLRQLASLGPQEGYVALDADTGLNPFTLEAAAHAAGAGMLAADLVLSGACERAFCCVRPPGHHAERARAMGFCFYNNIACAARQALNSGQIKRLAICDFDVHHGNGTQDIFAGCEQVLFCSSFQYPFYPQTDLGQCPSNVIHVPLPAGTGSRAFREAIEWLWLPSLEAFRPELVLISAGFDAHREDPLADLLLAEDDFRFVTQRLVAIAMEHAAGRVVSCLEGGYHGPALARSVVAHVRVLADLEAP